MISIIPKLSKVKKMKKMVLILLALASLSFAEETKKEDCKEYLKRGDDRLNTRNDPQGELKATAFYLRYQICKDLEKEQTKEGKK